MVYESLRNSLSWGPDCSPRSMLGVASGRSAGVGGTWDGAEDPGISSIQEDICSSIVFSKKPGGTEARRHNLESGLASHFGKCRNLDPDLGIEVDPPIGGVAVQKSSP